MYSLQSGNETSRPENEGLPCRYMYVAVQTHTKLLPWLLTPYRLYTTNVCCCTCTVYYALEAHGQTQHISCEQGNGLIMHSGLISGGGLIIINHGLIMHSLRTTVRDCMRWHSGCRLHRPNEPLVLTLGSEPTEDRVRVIGPHESLFQCVLQECPFNRLELVFSRVQAGPQLGNTSHHK